MSTVKARTLKGFRDYLPEADVPRQNMLRRIADVFESFGFGPLTTPALEYSEVLLGKYGEEGDKLLYRFLDNGERDVALRYDLTVPLARVVAEHRNLAMPFRRYQIAPVWRAEKPAKGRFREFLQCDVDIVGEASMTADAECMMVGLEVLAALGVPGYEIRVNNRKVLDGMLERVDVTDREQVAAVLRGVDKLPKIGRAGVEAELAEAGLNAAQVAGLFEVLELKVAPDGALAELGELLQDTERGTKGVEELSELLSIVSEAGFAGNVAVDLSIARGLDYYTGTIYETFVTDYEDYGSVMSGGRYDELLGMFLKESIPAVGISLGVDRLLSVLEAAGLVEQRSGVADVYVALFDQSGFGKLAGLARTLRAAGVKVEQSLADKRLGKQFKHAEKHGYRFVVLAGPDERERGEAQVKDLRSGEQIALPQAGLADWLLERLDR